MNVLICFVPFVKFSIEKNHWLKSRSWRLFNTSFSISLTSLACPIHRFKIFPNDSTSDNYASDIFGATNHFHFQMKLYSWTKKSEMDKRNISLKKIHSKMQNHSFCDHLLKSNTIQFLVVFFSFGFKLWLHWLHLSTLNWASLDRE